MTDKIFTIAHVPPELRPAWLQHLRDFDTAHPGCHFEVMADVPDASLAEMVEELRVTPELTFTQIIERTRHKYAMTEAQLNAMLKITREAVEAYEREKSLPAAEVRARLARLFAGDDT